MKKLPDKAAVRNWIQDFRRDVIRMMRLKFILVAMCILVGVFLVMLGSINMIMNTVSQSQSMRLLVQIAESERYNTLEENDGFNDQPVPPEQRSDDRTAELSRTGNALTLAWGEQSDRGNDRWNRREDMFPGEGETRESGEDRRPPEWDDPGSERPSENVPPSWEGEMTEVPAAPELAEPPQIDAQPEPTAVALPAEHPADVQPAEPPVQEIPPEEPPQEMPPEETSEPSDTETSTETMETAASESASSENVTETAAKETHPPAEPQTPPEPKDRRPDRWNVSVTIDHFAVMADAEGNFLGMRNTEDYSAEQAEEIMNGILAENKTQGMYDWLQFYRTEKSYGTLLVITDKTSDQGLLNNLFRTTVIIGTIMLLLLLAILIVLSRWITKPVHTAFTRQKQFVSDAGHELKTPIAVLTANADILQDEIGENKWLGYMQEQIGRMGQLVGDLLRLARMDNATQEYTFEEFDLSMAVAATTLPFESAAFEQHRNLEMDIQPEVRYYGSEQHIRQLCAIFIDNALKYSNENGVIKVTLLKRGEHQILEFYNTGCEISPEETEKIFERFYRGDKARNNKGKSGYGLGLAIAKSIMDVHKIKIQVTCEQGKWIRFLLTF